MAPSVGIGVSVTPARYWETTAAAFSEFAGPEAPVKVTATTESISATLAEAQARLTVTRRPDWFIADIGDHTMTTTPRQLKAGRFRISAASGWHTTAGACETARPAAPVKTSRTARTGRISAEALARRLTALVELHSDIVEHIQFAVTEEGHVGISTRSAVIATAASTGPIGDNTQTVMLPVALAAAVAHIIADSDDELTVTVDAAKKTVSIAFAATTVTATTRAATTPATSWPQRPQSDLARHDVIVTDLTGWHAASNTHRTWTSPHPTAHVRWDRESETLNILAKIGKGPVAVELPASTSDRFAVDLPWPALRALFAGLAPGQQVWLRYFEPNPTLTYLIAEFTDGDFTGFAYVGARRPDARLNA